MTLDIQASLSAERLTTPGSVLEEQAKIQVHTESDGTVQIASSGARPSVTIGQARRLVSAGQNFVKWTGQTLSVTRDERQILSIRKINDGQTKTDIRWWSLLRAAMKSR